MKYIDRLRAALKEGEIGESEFRTSIGKHLHTTIKNRIEVVCNGIFKTVDQFLLELGQQGGIIEACPSERLTAVKGSIGVVFEIEPDGEIHSVCNYDKVNLEFFRNIAAMAPQSLIKDFVPL